MRIKHTIVCAIILGLLLCGCADTAEPVSSQLPTESETVFTTEAPTETPTEAPTEAETAPTVLPYLQKVSYADQSIFDGPGYDYPFVGTVREAGTYTIVEEARDVEDNLWGRLKSGAGWIDLTEVRQRLEAPDPISANYADKLLLGSGNYHHYIGCTEEYAVQIAFRAQEPLTNVTLYSMTFLETMELDEALFRLPRLDPERPLVADLDFPGDMSTYAVLFTDSSGTDRCFSVYISGRNGTPVLAELDD